VISCVIKSLTERAFYAILSPDTILDDYCRVNALTASIAFSRVFTWITIPMIKSLKILAKQAEPTHVVLRLLDRLPYFVASPCDMTCDVSVEKNHQYYALSLAVQGRVTLICQRCLASFEHSYAHVSELAVCPDEAVAERLMPTMDCVVSEGDDIDLLAIVTDELHLFCPEKHADTFECDETTRQYLGESLQDSSTLS
jgi:uncharacterized protein